jgi:hypothetical protein
MFIFTVLLALCHISSAVDDIVITVTSPAPGRHYITHGLPPGVSLDVGSSSAVANMLRARPEAYEFCVDFDSLKQEYLSQCKSFVGGQNLLGIDLETMEVGNHSFRAFLKPKDEFANEEGIASQEDLASSAVEVPYSTGALPPPPSVGSSQSQMHAASDGSAASDGAAVEAVEEWVVSFHFSHDAHVAALHWGEPVFVLELERMVAQRYFRWRD